MALTVTDIFTVVRDIADTDSTELTDSISRSYLFRGFDELVSRQGDWKHYECEATFNTVNAQRDYTFASIDVAVVGASLADITSVVDQTTSNRPLQWIDYEDGLAIYHGTYTPSSEPRYWSVRYTAGAGKLNLWPYPSGVRSMRVSGYRTPNAWKTDAVGTPSATSPDVPDELSYCLIDYVLSCWFDQQEDLALSEKYRKKFEIATAEIIGAAQRAPQARPLIIGRGGGMRMNEKRWRESFVSPS